MISLCFKAFIMGGSPARFSKFQTEFSSVVARSG